MKEKKSELTKNENQIESQPEQKKSKLGVFILKHKMVFTLLIAIIVLAGWAFIKMAIMENKFEKQKAEIITIYENKIDSLTTKQLILTSKVFSWAIRSELTRENKEQVNQFFLSFIQESNVNKVMFVDATTSRTKISTDKKDEGMLFTNPGLQSDKTICQNKDSILQIISPVMGLNNKLGSLVIEYSKIR